MVTGFLLCVSLIVFLWSMSETELAELQTTVHYHCHYEVFCLFVCFFLAKGFSIILSVGSFVCKAVTVILILGSERE